MKKIKTLKIFWKLWSRYYQFHCWLREDFSRHLPKIRTKLPNPPHGGYCPKCGRPLKIHAYYIGPGDGYDFWWDCENEHWFDLEITRIIDWSPFVFGWWKYGDIEKIKEFVVK